MHKMIPIILVAALSTGPTYASEFRGTVVKVIDGDTLDLRIPGDTVRVRFCGIDTPERGKRGARNATSALRRMVAGKRLRCIQVGNGTPCDGRSRATNRGRIVAQCFQGTNDVAASLVRNGHACDWKRFSGGHYARTAGGKSCQH